MRQVDLIAQTRQASLLVVPEMPIPQTAMAAVAARHRQHLPPARHLTVAPRPAVALGIAHHGFAHTLRIRLSIGKAQVALPATIFDHPPLRVIAPAADPQRLHAAGCLHLDGAERRRKARILVAVEAPGPGRRLHRQQLPAGRHPVLPASPRMLDGRQVATGIVVQMHRAAGRIGHLRDVPAAVAPDAQHMPAIVRVAVSGSWGHRFSPALGNDGSHARVHDRGGFGCGQG